MSGATLAPTADGWAGTLAWGGRDVQVRVARDGVPGEVSLALAQAAMAALERLDAAARDAAARALLPEYNDGWRRGERHVDGRMQPFEDPPLDAAAFRARLALVSLEATGEGTLTLGYDAGPLFWGHAVFVTAFDGLAFEDTHAELFG